MIKGTKGFLEFHRYQVCEGIVNLSKHRRKRINAQEFVSLSRLDALNEAIENGTKRVAIPIERENELSGSAGVTKFYEQLNKKVLP